MAEKPKLLRCISSAKHKRESLVSIALRNALMAHSSSEGAGTKATGYALPEMGPFKCENCIHFDSPNKCDHKAVIADKDVPKTEDGSHAVVHGESCCNYFHPLDK